MRFFVCESPNTAFIMKLAIFDLDNTLLGGDSDVLWGEYLVALGIRDAATHGRENQRFYEEYQAGCLDIFAFQRFQLQVLTEYPLAQVLAWRTDYVNQWVRSLLLPKAQALIETHRAAGAQLLIITATNRFITAPIAELLGIAELIATEPEMVEGAYTGRITGTPSYAAGKVTRLQAWLALQHRQLDDPDLEMWFYSDSHNDLPLLRVVQHPVAVDADPILSAAATAAGWPLISLR